MVIKLHLEKHARNPESEVTEILPAVVVDRLHSAGIFNVKDCIDNLPKVKSLTRIQRMQVTAACYAQTLGSKGAGKWKRQNEKTDYLRSAGSQIKGHTIGSAVAARRPRKIYLKSESCFNKGRPAARHLKAWPPRFLKISQKLKFTLKHYQNG